ncbi:putative bifunctional diguanylate cyclase/phosphodiesterase [Pseudomonas sp. Marseille-QA0892]
MSLHLRTFKSHLARRLFFFVFLAVSMPVAVLATLTIAQVTDHLLQEHQQQMSHDAKQAGMMLFERLERMESDLASLPDAGGPRIRLVDPASVAWAWIDPRPYRGSLDAIRPDQHHTGDTALRFLDSRNGFKTFLWKRTPGGRWLGAVVSSDALWDASHWPEARSACVFEDDQPLPWCSVADVDALSRGLAIARRASSSGHFRWLSNDEPSLATYWGASFANVGLVAQWSVVVSEDERSFFAPIDQFQNNLIVVILVAILGAVLVGISQIKRVLRPLETLHDATRMVGAGEFGKPVELKSGDEFEALADAFNLMTARVAEQFRQIEGQAAIDGIILSSMNPQQAMTDVIARVRDLLNAECVAVVLKADEAVAEVHTKRRLHQASLSAADHCELFDTPSGARLVAHPPAWLPLEDQHGVVSWLVVPLRTGNETVGMVMLGSAQDRIALKARRPAIESGIGRITLAMTRALWQQRLYQQANTDDLTGLPNRAAFRQGLAATIKRAADQQTAAAILFIDLDRFKLINDTIGHATGDSFLQIIAQRIAACIGPYDMVARLGGDEFTLIVNMPSASTDVRTYGAQVVQRVLDTVALPAEVDAHTLRSTASIGVALYPAHGTDPDTLMKQADAAMYRAKHGGGNGYRFYTDEMQQAARDRLELESEIRQALEEGQFELHYQGQVDPDGRLVGAEALLRWPHPVRGMVSPAVFIPVAEESCLIADIDAWVLEEACRQLGEWHECGAELGRLSVNVSAPQFERKDFIDFVSGLLARYAVTPARLELEITEGALIGNLDHALKTLHGLRSLGVSLAIDDFGTGYSSLAYLKRFPVNKLKIDQAFVRGLGSPETDTAIVSAMLELCRHFGLQSVAEGVETVEERDWLVANGCDTYQGFYYCRPVPASAFLQTIQANRRIALPALNA